MTIKTSARLWALGFGNFIVGTGTFIVAGLMNEMAADLGESVVAIGQLMSGYALALTVGAPLLAGLTTRIDRRLLITVALVLYGLLHFAAAVAPGYGWLAVARVASGFVAAIVTPQSVAAAGLIVPLEQRGKAITTVFLGFSLSTVVGVPLGAALGGLFGWRTSMSVIGIAALASALWIWLVIPKRLFVAPMDARAWRALGGNAAILWVVATTVVHAAGQFTLFTYLAPIFKMNLAADAHTIGLLFGWFGLFGVVGNVVASRMIDRLSAARLVGVCLALIVTCFVIWPFTHASMAISLFAILLWGLGCFALNASQQTRLVTLAPALASASVALNSSAIYLGQALGGILGGALISAAGYGVLSWAGLCVLLAACVCAWMAGRAVHAHALR